MNKRVVIFFQNNGNKKRMPIIKAFNVPSGIKMPKNITTLKTLNMSIVLSAPQKGSYKVIGTFKDVENVNYLDIKMLMKLEGDIYENISDYEKQFLL
jgi:hypothetical protein